MLAHRIIPTILMKNGHLVKGERFKADRIVGNALQAARIHAMRGVDEITILTVRGETDFDLIRKLTQNTTVPVTVGGGINTLWATEKAFDAGADKVCIKYEDSGFIEVLAKKYGSQAVVAAVNVSVGYGYIPSTINMVDEVEDAGAGEVLLQAIGRDGTMSGYDLDLIDISNYTGLPVIASGGCSGYPDMLAAINAGASAVAAGALFQFTNATPRGAAEYLHSHDVEVRL